MLSRSWFVTLLMLLPPQPANARDSRQSPGAELPSDEGNMPTDRRTTLVVVRPVPGDPVASGQALQQAYFSATHANAAQPVLLLIAPGTYDLGARFEMTMPFVHLRGSGESLTRIKGFINVYVPGISIRDLTVESSNTGILTFHPIYLKDLSVEVAGDAVVGLLFVSGGTGSVIDVSIRAHSATGFANGIRVFTEVGPTLILDRARIDVTSTEQVNSSGIMIGAPLRMNAVSISSSDTGLDIIGTGVEPVVTVTNSRIEGTRRGMAGTSSGPSRITLIGSSVISPSSSIDFTFISTAMLKVATSMLDGLVNVTGQNTIACVGSFSGTLQPLDAACAPQ